MFESELVATKSFCWLERHFLLLTFQTIFNTTFLKSRLRTTERLLISYMTQTWCKKHGNGIRAAYFGRKLKKGHKMKLDIDGFITN